MSLRVDIESPASDVRLLICHGEIDTLSFDLLEDVLDRVLKAGIMKVLVDLSDVPRICSAGIGVLVGCKANLVDDLGGALLLISPQPEVLRVFEVMEYAAIFTLVGSRAEAIGAVSAD